MSDVAIAATAPGVSRVERIANDEYDVIPDACDRRAGMSRCQYSGAAEVNGTSPARVAAALCDGFVKGQIRAKNSTVYFEQASEEAAVCICRRICCPPDWIRSRTSCST